MMWWALTAARSVPQLVLLLIHNVLNPAALGGVGVAMILTRELYPSWRSSLLRAMYDLALVAIVLLMLVFVTLRMVALI